MGIKSNTWIIENYFKTLLCSLNIEYTFNTFMAFGSQRNIAE